MLLVLFIFVAASCGFRMETSNRRVNWSPHKIYFPGPISHPDPDKYHQDQHTENFNFENYHPDHNIDDFDFEHTIGDHKRQTQNPWPPQNYQHEYQKPNAFGNQKPYNQEPQNTFVNQKPDNQKVGITNQNQKQDNQKVGITNQSQKQDNQKVVITNQNQKPDNQKVGITHQDLKVVTTQRPENSNTDKDNDLAANDDEVCVLTAALPDPETLCCGVEAASTNRIVGGNATDIDQYPWLVLIQYYDKAQDRYKNLCGGFLISGRYVLSAAHCFYGEVLEYGTPVNVILGEYNITNQGPDCAINIEGNTICTDGAITVGIEETIVHPEHFHNRTVSYNDIALIRLNQTVKDTENVRAICLPSTDVTADVPPNLTLYTAGWGAIKQRLVIELGRKVFAGEYDFVKRHVDLPIVKNEVCKNTFPFITKGHICAGGERGKDSCRGDSGGPLMHENDGIYEAIGIVSTGPLKKPCGTEGYPAVYTKVYDYLDWIKKGIRV